MRSYALRVVEKDTSVSDTFGGGRLPRSSSLRAPACLNKVSAKPQQVMPQVPLFLDRKNPTSACRALAWGQVAPEATQSTGSPYFWLCQRCAAYHI